MAFPLFEWNNKVIVAIEISVSSLTRGVSLFVLFQHSNKVKRIQQYNIKKISVLWVPATMECCLTFAFKQYVDSVNIEIGRSVAASLLLILLLQLMLITQ